MLYLKCFINLRDGQYIVNVVCNKIFEFVKDVMIILDITKRDFKRLKEKDI